MSRTYGADVAELRRLAGEFRIAADELDRDGGMMTRLLNGVDWIGGVASRFTSQWTGVQLPRISLSTRFLREAADQLTRNADQQERASGGAAAGAGGSGSIPIPGATIGPGGRLQGGGGPPLQGTHPRIQGPGAIPPPEGGLRGADGQPSHGGTDVPPPVPSAPVASPAVDGLTEDTGAVEQRFRSEWGPEPGRNHDRYNFLYNPGGNCTSYVAWRLNDLAEQAGMDWSMDNNRIGDAELPRLGDAHEWGAHAAEVGFPADDTPRPGAVAYWDIGDGKGYSTGDDGHVGIVREVRADGTIVVEESAWGSSVFSVTTYSPNDSDYPGGFLHLLPGS